MLDTWSAFKLVNDLRAALLFSQDASAKNRTVKTKQPRLDYTISLVIRPRSWVVHGARRQTLFVGVSSLYFIAPLSKYIHIHTVTHTHTRARTHTRTHTHITVSYHCDVVRGSARELWSSKWHIRALEEPESYISLGLCNIITNSRYPIWDCSLTKNCGHVRDMVDF